MQNRYLCNYVGFFLESGIRRLSYGLSIRTSAPAGGTMASSDIDELEAPFEVRSRREPRTGAGVRVVAISRGEPARAEEIARGLVDRLMRLGREAESRVVDLGDGGWAAAL